MDVDNCRLLAKQISRMYPYGVHGEDESISAGSVCHCVGDRRYLAIGEVPEPGSLVLLLIGIATLVTRRRHQ